MIGEQLEHWRENSLQLDLDPTSFTLHRRCSHFKLFLPLTFHLFSLFSPIYALSALLLYSFSAFSDIHLSAFSTAFQHSTSCSPMKMLNFLNSFTPLQLFCLFFFFLIFIFLPFHLLQPFCFMFKYENVQLFKLFQPSSVFLPFNLLKIFIFVPLQLFHIFCFMFRYKKCLAIDMFNIFFHLL